MTSHPRRPGMSGPRLEAEPWDPDINEVRVARYRDLIESGRYHRGSRDLALRILEQDLSLFPARQRWSE